MECPPELIGFGNGAMAAKHLTPEQEAFAVLSWIVENYASDMSHVDFRVDAYRFALAALGKLPKEGEYAGIPLSELARSGVLGWHPADEA
jgi:hypothetical protein